MDQKLLHEREARCVQENPPGCTAGCPVHVDARGMIFALGKGDYNAGFALFYKMVPFPGIISRICDHPCQDACIRKEIDDPISIHAFEKVCVENNTKTTPALIVPQLKSKKTAVVGAGLSGLTVAVDLARKGYAVSVFEATGNMGGSIREIPESKLPHELMEKDFALFAKLPVEFKYNISIGNQAGAISNESIIFFESICADFDAVYLGTGFADVNYAQLGLSTDDHGNPALDPLTLATSHSRIFAGGSLRRKRNSRSPVSSISDGRIAAISIDRLFQNVSISANREKEGPFATTLYTNIKDVTPQSVIPMSDPAGYTKEEASQEACRCLQCVCCECVKECEYLAHFGSYPKKYIREIYNNLSIVMGFRQSNKMINSCSLCGLCGEVCPNNLNMGQVCREARQTMVKKKKMPSSAHEFALRDMAFSNSDQFSLSRHQPGFTSSSTVFFPGCQLAASSPHQVKQVYEFLTTKIDGGVGLMLGCCGVPADWAGQEELFIKTIQNIERNWYELGSPNIITACPSCFGMFKLNLPNVNVEMMWTLLDRIGLPENAGSGISPLKLAVHDSCTTRYETQLQNSVRNILNKLGHRIEELPRSREKTICCGYGGLMIFVNREVANKEINRRIHESASDYLTYCSMCKDNFAGLGKRTYHLLDLAFGDRDSMTEKKAPDYSERQENRAHLKRILLKEIWSVVMEEPKADIKLIIPENIRKLMEERMILVTDVSQVISNAEKTDTKMLNSWNDHCIAYFRPANVTYWVEYSFQDDGFLIHNTYSHRLQISG